MKINILILVLIFTFVSCSNLQSDTMDLNYRLHKNDGKLAFGNYLFSKKVGFWYYYDPEMNTSAYGNYNLIGDKIGEWTSKQLLVDSDTKIYNYAEKLNVNITIYNNGIKRFFLMFENDTCVSASEYIENDKSFPVSSFYGLELSNYDKELQDFESIFK